jgi:protein TonB
MDAPATITALRDTTSVRRRPETLRWVICLTAAICLHAVAAAAFMLWNPAVDVVADAPVITVELAPVPVAPDMKTQLPPGPQQQAAPAESEPQELPDKLETRLEQANEADLAVTQAPPAEKTTERQPKRKHASVATAPSAADTRGARAAAPAPGATSQNPDALPSWKSALLARLERFKRYPPEAQSRGESGTAQLAFSIDRSGGVHGAHIIRSSGSSLLDRETLALPLRASPMPPPPPEVIGAQIPIVVPIRYNAR